MSKSKGVIMKKYVIAVMLLATCMVQAQNPVKKAYGVESIKIGGILGNSKY